MSDESPDIDQPGPSNSYAAHIRGSDDISSSFSSSTFFASGKCITHLRETHCYKSPGVLIYS